MTDQTPSPAADMVAMLAALSGEATAGQQRLLAIITQPENTEHLAIGDTPMETADYYRDQFGGYDSYGFLSEAQTIADVLFAHYSGQDDAPDFSFDYSANSEGEIGGFGVTAATGDHPHRVILATYHDLRSLTVDRDATGLAAALAIAEALDDDYQRLVTTLRTRLLPTTVTAEARDTLVARAASALSAYDAVPADDDIDVDTLAEVRDTLAALLRLHGAEAQE